MINHDEPSLSHSENMPLKPLPFLAVTRFSFRLQRRECAGHLSAMSVLSGLSRSCWRISRWADSLGPETFKPRLKKEFLWPGQKPNQKLEPPRKCHFYGQIWPTWDISWYIMIQVYHDISLYFDICCDSKSPQIYGDLTESLINPDSSKPGHNDYPWTSPVDGVVSINGTKTRQGKLWNIPGTWPTFFWGFKKITCQKKWWFPESYMLDSRYFIVYQYVPKNTNSIKQPWLSDFQGTMILLFIPLIAASASSGTV